MARSSWTRDFIKTHLSKSVPGLAVQTEVHTDKSYKFFEFVDVPDLEHHGLHYNLVTNFDFPHHASIVGSTDGLLFLHDSSSETDAYYICNPITRDYFKLNCPEEFDYSYPQAYTFGFGTSRMTGQHKVVKIFHNYLRIYINQETYRFKKIPESECHLYTLETGSWRRLGPGAPLMYSCSNGGAFVKGNLHWLVCDSKGSPWISYFDLETELFSTFSPPPLQEGHEIFVADMFTLEDCLCLCDNGSDEQIVVWLIKEYGVEKSWTKEFVISKIPEYVGGDLYIAVRPVKVFKDGDILMAWEDWLLSYYSSKTKRIQKVDAFGPGCTIPIIHTPSFLSLKSFDMGTF